MLGLSIIAAMSMFLVFMFMAAESDSGGSFDTWFSRTLAGLSATVCFSCVCIIIWKLAQ